MYAGRRSNELLVSKKTGERCLVRSWYGQGAKHHQELLVRKFSLMKHFVEFLWSTIMILII